MMTEEQINRMPLICRRIVRSDREREAIYREPIVSFDNYKRLRKIREDYTRDAARIFMPLSIKDGPQTSV